mmetsp:Transcript_38828/g.85019  ORF Transcript_38828/g.85019 Transcript_38828/m.85019 type:complete len:421 (+) Transcript_38828:49-1311(+)
MPQRVGSRRCLGLMVLGAGALMGGAPLFAAPSVGLEASQPMGRVAFGLRSSSALANDPSAESAGSARSTVTTLAPLLAVAAALIKRRSARAASKAEVPDGLVPRSERDVQVLPLGRRLQKFFSRRDRQFWNYNVFPKTYFNRRWLSKDVGYAVFFAAIHFGAAMAPFYFTWKAFACFLVGYLITGLFGITLSYHRQLAHRSFTTPKWLEYVFAYCGALALQSHPINWVSSHRHHHGGTETENDVHSPLDGFWWSHMGWLLDGEGTWMRRDKSNAGDLQAQPFYRWLQKTYALNAIVLPIVGLYLFGGLPCVLWGFFARVVWVWHVTWAVNSVSHVWGFKDWNTKDNSMNNWLVGLLAFGEGWHNNHHAFETSCRHGLKWWQVDPTWYVVKMLSWVGLASNLKYPSESKMKKLSFPVASAA